MYPVSPQAYDRAITVFSPDGRLFQVEYAKEAVRRGATAVGVVAEDGVVIAAHKTVPSKLLVHESMKKIFLIDDRIAVTASGLVADARRLVDIARNEAQRYRMTYGEEASVEYITKQLCDLMQLYTQYGGIRPFGVSLLIAGFDDSARLFESEPSGALSGYTAGAIGAGKKDVEEFFEKEYKEGMSLEEAEKLAVKALKKVTEQKLSAVNIDMAVIDKKTKKFRILPDEEVDAKLK